MLCICFAVSEVEMIDEDEDEDEDEDGDEDDDEKGEGEGERELNSSLRLVVDESSKDLRSPRRKWSALWYLFFRFHQSMSLAVRN